MRLYTSCKPHNKAVHNYQNVFQNVYFHLTLSYRFSFETARSDSDKLDESRLSRDSQVKYKFNSLLTYSSALVARFQNPALED